MVQSSYYESLSEEQKKLVDARLLVFFKHNPLLVHSLMRILYVLKREEYAQLILKERGL